MEVEKLVVALEARTKAFETALTRADAKANRTVKSIEARFAKANKNVSLSLGDMGGNFAKIFAVAGSLRGAQQLIDASTKIDNALKTTGLSGEALSGVYDKLFASAQKNAAPIESLVDLYGKAALVQRELGVSNADLLSFTDNVALALRASGKSAQEASGALLQLGQALGSGTVRAEEFNSIQEGAPTILKAVAAGLTATGGSVAKLRALVIAGEVSSKEFFDSFQRGKTILDSMVSGSQLTIDQGFTRLKNTLIDVAGRLDKVTGASGLAGEGLSRMASVIENLATVFERASGNPIIGFIGKLDELIKRFEPIQQGLRILSDPQAMGAVGDLLSPATVDKAYDTIAKLNAQFDAMRGGLAAMKPDAVDAFDELQRQLNAADIRAGAAALAIDAIVGGDPKLAEIKRQFDPLLKALGEVEREALVAIAAAKDVSRWRYDNFRATGFSGLAQREAGAKFLSDRNADASRTDTEKEIDSRTKEIITAAEKVGVAITEAAAKIQASKEIAAEDIAQSSSKASATALDLIKNFEGFIAKPKFDVNALRVGYGSDTVTLADGSVQKVVAGISVSVADANRDLVRRIGEFQDGIRDKIGADTFGSFDENQQAALTSIAYNYGSLPQRIVEAIKTGNQATVVQAIRGLGSDNKGVNRDRRNTEADTFLGGAPSGVKREVRGQDNYKASLADIQARIDLLNQEASAQAGVNPLIDDYGYAVEKARITQELLNDAQANGIAITPQLRAQIDQLAGDYAKASAAGDQLAESQGNLQQKLSESSAFGKNVLGGFIRDLRDGKSATEALAGALEKVADKLLDVALNSLFDGPKAGSGGGLLGGLFSIFGFAKGGIAAHGRPLKRFAGGGVSRSAAIFGEAGPEAAVPLPDGRSIPVSFKGGNIPGGRAGGQAVHVTVGVGADNNGNLMPFVQSVSQEMVRKAAPQIVQSSVKTVNSKLPGMMANAQSRSL